MLSYNTLIEVRHRFYFSVVGSIILTLLHSEQPKLHRVLAVLSAIGLTLKAPITTVADNSLEYFLKICISL